METSSSLAVRRVALDRLHPDPANARLHGERNLEAIAASLARFQQVESLVVQKSSGRVIGGNGRLAAMKSLGWTEADVVEVDLDDTQATALGIALNRTAELAEWDLPSLGRLLQSLEADGALDGVGFDEAEMQQVLDDLLAGRGFGLGDNSCRRTCHSEKLRYTGTGFAESHTFTLSPAGSFCYRASGPPESDSPSSRRLKSPRTHEERPLRMTLASKSCSA